jgi:hypothetical protein
VLKPGAWPPDLNRMLASARVRVWPILCLIAVAPIAACGGDGGGGSGSGRGGTESTPPITGGDSGGAKAGAGGTGGGGAGGDTPGAAGGEGPDGGGTAGAGGSTPGSDADPGVDGGQAGDGALPEPIPGTVGSCTPEAAQHLFVDAIAESAWLNVDLAPAGGMRALADELARLAREDRDRPVRVRLAPGDYAPTDPGRGELYIEDLQRTAAAPLLIQATDPAPNATRLSQGFVLVGVGFLAFDGLTIGPAVVGAYHGGAFCGPGACFHDAPKPLSAEAGFHVSGTALAPTGQGLKDGHLDFSVYGRFAPAHDIVIRRATIQNLFGDDEPSGADAAGGGSDGIKFNQAANVWVTGTRIRQTSRHGIDNVGVHGGCFLGNVIADTGVGLGIEAKGGSIDVTFDGNTFINVRRLELGGENTDATYYWSAEMPGTPLHYAYEGRRIVARNNLIVDPRTGGMEFSGCHDCAAVGNTLFYHPAFASDEGGDAVREVDSMINRDGAGSSCAELNGDEITECWHVGPYPQDLVQVPGEDGMSRPLTNARNTLGNNLFLNASGKWGLDLAPYNHPNSTHSFGLTMVDYNYWWNAANPLVDPDDGTWLKDGPHSVFAASSASGGIDVAFVASSPSVDVAASVRAALRPRTGTALVGKGAVIFVGYAPYDGNQAARPNPPSVGALEP